MIKRFDRNAATATTPSHRATMLPPEPVKLETLPESQQNTITEELAKPRVEPVVVAADANLVLDPVKESEATNATATRFGTFTVLYDQSHQSLTVTPDASPVERSGAPRAKTASYTLSSADGGTKLLVVVVQQAFVDRDAAATELDAATEAAIEDTETAGAARDAAEGTID